MARQTNLTILVGALVAFGALAAFQVATDDDGGSSASGGSISESTEAPDDTSGPVDTATGAETTIASTAAPGTVAPVQPVAKPPASQLQGLAVAFQQFLPDLKNLTGMVWNASEGAYYATSQDGQVHKIAADLSSSEVVLDLTSEVPDLEPGSERGMLGIEFDPRNGRMFLHFNDNDGHTNLVSFAMSGGRPDPATRRLVLFVEQPGPGHNGGKLLFTPEGVLYIALGDGGGSRGRDAQDYTKLLGNILRIVPRVDAEGYDIPADNPYATSTDRRPEIFVKGLRNPWQFTIDPSTGDMYIGDVGEDTTEELDIVPAGTSGQNFGWYWFEGTDDRGIGGIPAGLELTPPIFEYTHADVGPAIVGGQFYLGSAIPNLRGAFFFVDMTGPAWAMGEGNEEVRLNLSPPAGNSSFGVMTSVVTGPDGEIYVLTLRNGIYKLVPG